SLIGGFLAIIEPWSSENGGVEVLQTPGGVGGVVRHKQIITVRVGTPNFVFFTYDLGYILCQSLSIVICRADHGTFVQCTIDIKCPGILIANLQRAVIQLIKIISTKGVIVQLC